MSLILTLTIRNTKNYIAKKYQSYVIDITTKPLPAGLFFTVTTCADDEESVGVETTGMASVGLY